MPEQQEQPQAQKTFIRPPPLDPSRSAVENALDLTPLADFGPDIFTNTRPLWHAPTARGIYGGAVVAQSLSAAQQTVPHDFSVHSMHCTFILAGSGDIPVIYHVDHVREGRSFATRIVQAKQRGRCIFTSTLSFFKEGSGGEKTLEHKRPMTEVEPPVEDATDAELSAGGIEAPFQSYGVDVKNEHGQPHEKIVRRWHRAWGPISEKGGHNAHLIALAYLSDRWFVGTAWGVHLPPEISVFQDSRSKTSQSRLGDGSQDRQPGAKFDPEKFPQPGMMVSLDHTIYFHDPRGFRADEWLLTEMESPWSGDGRALTIQRMYTRHGKLIASCFQEGIIRLKQGQDLPSSKL
ncbi:MAG: hypothetical protein M1823_000665 [Watsoniomyces obsoletus]|nr:MAG: hypothetical protein M1823_000665 [Watsoniomyces obsoletus]